MCVSLCPCVSLCVRACVDEHARARARVHARARCMRTRMRARMCVCACTCTCVCACTWGARTRARVRVRVCAVHAGTAHACVGCVRERHVRLQRVHVRRVYRHHVCVCRVCVSRLCVCVCVFLICCFSPTEVFDRLGFSLSFKEGGYTETDTKRTVNSKEWGRRTRLLFQNSSVFYLKVKLQVTFYKKRTFFIGKTQVSFTWRWQNWLSDVFYRCFARENA